jgi:hypothetical protein
VSEESSREDERPSWARSAIDANEDRRHVLCPPRFESRSNEGALLRRESQTGSICRKDLHWSASGCTAGSTQDMTYNLTVLRE